MAVVNGSTGAVMIGTHVVYFIEKWTGNITGGTVEDTPGFRQTAKARIMCGLETMDGSFNGSIDNTDTAGQRAFRTASINKTTVSLILYEETNVYHSFNAYIESVGLDCAPETAGKASYTFKSTGTITHTYPA